MTTEITTPRLSEMKRSLMLSHALADVPAASSSKDGGGKGKGGKGKGKRKFDESMVKRDSDGQFARKAGVPNDKKADSSDIAYLQSQGVTTAALYGSTYTKQGKKFQEIAAKSITANMVDETEWKAMTPPQRKDWVEKVTEPARSYMERELKKAGYLSDSGPMAGTIEVKRKGRDFVPAIVYKNRIRHSNIEAVMNGFFHMR